MRKNYHFTAGGRRLARARKPKQEPKVSSDEKPRVGQDAPAQGVEAADAGDESSSAAGKRLLDDAEGIGADESERSKRLRLSRDDGEDCVEVKIEGEEADLSATSNEDASSQDEDEQVFLRPRLATTKSGAGLLSRPNPLTFARRKWTSVPPEDPPEIPKAATTSHSSLHCSTDDDADLPVTPQDDAEHSVLAVNGKGDLPDDYDDYDDYDDESASDDSQERVILRPMLAMKSRFSGPMTFKPSPFNLARRRWGPSASASVTDAADVAQHSADHLDAPSGSSVPSFTDLFEADGQEDPDGASPADRDDSAPGSVDPDVSSEEESFRPSILSIFKPGRRSSSASSALVDLTDDSEQIVERLVAVSDPPTSSAAESRPTTANSAPLPSPPSPQKSPGMAWKQTVLLPMNVPFLHSVSAHATATVTLTADISPAPTKLMRAGWDSGSSDETD
ncbi:hypothetical protein ONZ51_g3421 [Trametes cubensis]|uniref:Uncharacterized protein n=1 Tax=Trametes cubensis TaxID=1111947 RepID=A0AAD7XDX6_9APHY|nr:hypothetical protein ONZ51_g3421 [Trametes cubensis]